MMIDFLVPAQGFLFALLIFGLRIIDTSLATVRVLFVVRGRRLLAWILGFFQALLYVFAISSVLANLDNWYYMLAYAAGFATGVVVGIMIEERIAVGHTHLTIISPLRGAVIAEKLREGGFAVTEVPARGKDGTVGLLICNVNRRDFHTAEEIVEQVDSEAFITAENVTPVRRGFWRA
jgi:uncharacterized protein YebE (UPF0316 family)